MKIENKELTEHEKVMLWELISEKADSLAWYSQQCHENEKAIHYHTESKFWAVIAAKLCCD